jgi:hypothetical protein
MVYKKMECPGCKGIWSGWIPEPRDKNFLERCNKCDKIVTFKDVTDINKLEADQTPQGN